MSNRIVRTLALVAFCALAACTAPKTANAPAEGIASLGGPTWWNGPERITSLDRPSFTVIKAFMDKGWIFDSVDREGGDRHAVVTLFDPDSEVMLRVLLFDPLAGDHKTSGAIEQGRYRLFTDGSFGDFENRLRNPSDGDGPRGYFYDVYDQGAQMWNVTGGRYVEGDGKDLIAVSTHSAYPQQKLWVQAHLMAISDDRPEGLRAVTTDVVNTLAALTLDPA